MQISSIVEKIRSQADMIESQFLTDEDIINYISNATAQLHDIIQRLDGDSMTIIIPASGNLFFLPSDFDNLVAITSSKCERIEKLSLEEVMIEKKRGYRIVGQTLRMSKLEDVNIAYLPKFIPYTDETDIFEYDERFVNFVVYCSVVEGKLKSEEGIRDFEGKRLQELAKIENILSHKDMNDLDVAFKR